MQEATRDGWAKSPGRCVAARPLQMRGCVLWYAGRESSVTGGRGEGAEGVTPDAKLPSSFLTSDSVFSLLAVLGKKVRILTQKVLLGVSVVDRPLSADDAMAVTCAVCGAAHRVRELEVCVVAAAVDLGVFFLEHVVHVSANTRAGG